MTAIGVGFYEDMNHQINRPDDRKRSTDNRRPFIAIVNKLVGLVARGGTQIAFIVRFQCQSAQSVQFTQIIASYSTETTRYALIYIDAIDIMEVVN